MGQKVEFTASVENGNLVWAGPDGKPAKDHKLNIAQGAPRQEIEIKIKSDQSAKQLGLQVDTNAPLHVAQDNGQCPSNGIDTDQIKLVSCDANSVTISNENSGNPCTLRYQVNVIDKEGNQCPCDPIIQNGGAGPGM